MNRKEPTEDNVSFLLGSLVRPIGRGVPGEDQEDQTAAVKCHDSAFSPGQRHNGDSGLRAPRTFSLGAAHTLRWGGMSTEWSQTQQKPWCLQFRFCLLHCRQVGWVVLECSEATSCGGCQWCFLKEKRGKIHSVKSMSYLIIMTAAEVPQNFHLEGLKGSR